LNQEILGGCQISIGKFMITLSDHGVMFFLLSAGIIWKEKEIV
jgi:hypothetical protein